MVDENQQLRRIVEIQKAGRLLRSSRQRLRQLAQEKSIESAKAIRAALWAGDQADSEQAHDTSNSKSDSLPRKGLVAGIPPRLEANQTKTGGQSEPVPHLIPNGKSHPRAPLWRDGSQAGIAFRIIEEKFSAGIYGLTDETIKASIRTEMGVRGLQPLKKERLQFVVREYRKWKNNKT